MSEETKHIADLGHCYARLTVTKYIGSTCAWMVIHSPGQEAGGVHIPASSVSIGGVENLAALRELLAKVPS